VSEENVTLVMVVGLPLVVVLLLGLLVRELINNGGRWRGLVWLVGLVVCTWIWIRFLSGVP
jgi:hypothetical protein